MKPAVNALIAEHSAARIAIRRRDQTTPLLVQQATPNRRPYIHPIIAPDGNGTLTEDAPPHHPWQHGLYVGLMNVNGVGFWLEGARNTPTDGTFHPQPLVAPIVNDTRCSWSVTSDWRAPNGQSLLVENQAWSLHDRGTSYELDLLWTVTASVDLTFGKYAYGGLFVRTPFVSDGTAVNSEGLQTPALTDALRARWVAIALPIPDRTGSDQLAGLAMMDHPGNPEHPVPWRVDAQLGISPSRCIAGAWSLAAGAAVTARHRVFIHLGATDVSAIEANWATFAQ